MIYEIGSFRETLGEPKGSGDLEETQKPNQKIAVKKIHFWVRNEGQ